MSQSDKKLSVALADGNDIMRAEVVALLEKWGYRVNEFGDAKSLAAHIEGNPVDIVVAATRLTSFTGLQLLRHIKGHVRLKALPVIVMGPVEMRIAIEREGGLYVDKFGSGMFSSALGSASAQRAAAA